MCGETCTPRDMCVGNSISAATCITMTLVLQFLGGQVDIMPISKINIPYIGKFSRYNNFTIFADLPPTSKI